MIVMSRKLDRERPDLAGKFYTAFEQAKRIAYDDILPRPGLLSCLLERRKKEQIAAWDDPWKYGLREQIDHRRLYQVQCRARHGPLAIFLR